MRKKAAALVIAWAALAMLPVTAQASPIGASTVSSSPASGCVGSKTNC
jgi:hypothetical protein